MAVLWPRKLPRSVLDDPRRRAEVRVYNRLAEVLNDTFHVFYSSPWLGTDRLGNEKDGECDFLVAHPDHGILAIEVKGGRRFPSIQRTLSGAALTTAILSTRSRIQ